MIKYLPTIVVFRVELFFAVSAIIGYEYGGSEISSSYIIYNIALFILTLIVFLSDICKNGKVKKIIVIVELLVKNHQFLDLEH